MFKAVVIALKETETGNKHYLQRNNKNRAPVHHIRLGKAKYCDIVINDPTIKDVHCTLVCSPEGVRVSAYSADGETWVNEVKLGNGDVVLQLHDVIRLGSTLLNACGETSDERPHMVVRDLYETVQKARYYHPSRLRAAEAINVPESTYRRWLAIHKFKAAVVAGVVIGAGWMAFTGQPADTDISSTIVPAAGTLSLPAPVHGEQDSTAEQSARIAAEEEEMKRLERVQSMNHEASRDSIADSSNDTNTAPNYKKSRKRPTRTVASSQTKIKSELAPTEPPPSGKAMNDNRPHVVEEDTPIPPKRRFLGVHSTDKPRFLGVSSDDVVRQDDRL